MPPITEEDPGRLPRRESRTHVVVEQEEGDGAGGAADVLCVDGVCIERGEKKGEDAWGKGLQPPGRQRQLYLTVP